jgi:uncharacterized Zn finger protein (UPF0148 family)
MKDKRTADLRGIVVAGDSRQQAESHYRAVATGSSVKAFEDAEHSFLILSNADNDLDLINPLTGEMDLVAASTDVIERLDFFKAESAGGAQVETFYTVCADGCGSHIIADDPELMHNCPVCASELTDLTEEEILAAATSGEEDDDSSEGELDDSGYDVEASEDSDAETFEDAIIATASTFDEAVAKFKQIALGKANSTVYACGDGKTNLVCTSSALKSDFRFSPYTGEKTTLLDGATFSVEASADENNLDAHWYVCASDECGTHVISSSEEPVFCPVCASGLIEPEETVPQSSLSSDDEDEDDDEELEDEDDDEELEDEGEDDEEDLDDDNAISVSSVTLDADEGDSSSVSVNLLSLASAKGEMQAANLAVARVGAIANESRWMAFYDGSPIAIARARDTKQDSSVFESEVFGTIVAASAKENGVIRALKELGFTPIQATAAVDDYVAQEIEQQVAARVESVSGAFVQQSEDFSGRFYTAIAAAADGMNKNFFQDVSNPVKGALVATMSSLGIRNPERLVAQAFAEHNNSYLKNLLRKTQEIMKYDVAVQNQLTEAIAGAAKEMVVTASESISMGTPVANAADSGFRETIKPRLEVVSSNMSMDAILATLKK